VFVMLNMIRPSSHRTDHALIPVGPEKPNYFIGSLWDRPFWERRG
jgi:hypothetical protein